MVFSTKEHTESEQQTEVSNREIFRQVADFVGQAQIATLSMGVALDEMEQSAGEVIAVGLNALESADDANNALWKAREELAILQFLFTMTEDSIDHFQQAFLIIRSLRQGGKRKLSQIMKSHFLCRLIRELLKGY